MTETAAAAAAAARPDEAVEVDVSTVEPIQALRSSDEEGDGVEDLDYLPIAPEVRDAGWEFVCRGEVCVCDGERG